MDLVTEWKTVRERLATLGAPEDADPKGLSALVAQIGYAVRAGKRKKFETLVDELETIYFGDHNGHS